MEFFARFLQKLEQRYPASAAEFDFHASLSPLLVSSSTISLPWAFAEQAKTIVKAFWELRGCEQRNSALRALKPSVVDPGNSSILMSYDFHVDSDGQLRLIEINTNASMSLMTELLYEVQEVTNPFEGEFRAAIMRCFHEEARLAGFDQVKRAAIMDENPPAQKLFAEFKLYEELFRRQGWYVNIAGPEQFVFADGRLTLAGEPIDLIYNRHTDFYFQTEVCQTFRAAMNARTTCLTPHPHEYRLLADKDRLKELSQAKALESLPLSDSARSAITSTLIHTIETDSVTDPEAFWAERKKWFFKPARSYGGKAAYRGASISRPVYKQILSGGYLAQEFVPAPLIKVGPTGEEFKYDLRFFVYRDTIQLACARLYRGQMTNAQTPGGGVTAIKWV